MAQCPHCGATVDDYATVCQNCGASLGGQHDQQPQQGNQPRQGGGQAPPPGQPQDEQFQGQPQQNQSQPQQPGRQTQQPGGQPPRGPPGQGGSGTSRRNLLKYGGGAAVLGVGGFLIWDNFLSGRSPEETVREFYTALNQSNTNRANELIHSESPTGELSESEASQLEGEISLESTELINETGETAFVRANISFSNFGSSEAEIELRKEDGEWKIWE